MAEAALASLRKAQAAVIDAFQQEFFCDELTPPDGWASWSNESIRAFFESGGSVLPAAAPSAAVPTAAIDITDDAATAGPDPALQQFLQESEEFAHLCEPLAALSWDECEALYQEGRPKLLSKLGKLGVKLSERQKFVTVFGKANKPVGAVKAGQPGGGRPQPTPFEEPPVEGLGQPIDELVKDVSGYQAQVVRDGIPDRSNGLFPPDDEFLKLLATTRKPFTKGLPKVTADGTYAFGVVANGWASGELAIEHGMDLRLFLAPGLDEKSIDAAVRFSDGACIGRGVRSAATVHGGAVETCLDEATAECAKVKLFPMATTAKIEFRITKALLPHVTYGVRCKVEKEHVAGISYDVTGEIFDPKDSTVLAKCTAKMANPFAL